MLIKSLLKIKDTIHPTEEIRQWIIERNKDVEVKIEKIPFLSYMEI